jgi:hypothetical protein
MRPFWYDAPPGEDERAQISARRIRLLARGAYALMWAAAAAVVFTAGPNPAAQVTIDAAANRRAINPLIYGVAYATPAQIAELRAPLNRMGGNHTSRYNWQLNAYNRAHDWYFESIGEASAVPGESADTFIDQARAAGAQPLITVPMLEWVARLAPQRGKLASFSIAKYGPQTGNDWQWFPDAGNGVRTSGGFVTGNDPVDANTLVNTSFQQGWVQHLVGRLGGAAAGGQRYYILDNEPSLWHSTHRDVHPGGATMDEVRTRLIDYATAIKAIDANAQIIGPEESGWSGYFYSGADQQWGSANGWGSPLPDRSAHGNADYLPWLLDQLRQQYQATGQRPVDVVSVHYYPQGGEYGDSTTSAVQLLRNRSTRSLWDPTYVDESWINDRVQLIPRLRSWVNAHYLPGTPIAITEYNWGAEGHISGAIAQADLLGIFGREGLDMAARWTTPAATTPTFKAMKMYRNYDGQGAGFGEVSVRASGSNPDTVAAFAAERSIDGALTIMVLNKYLTGHTPVTFSLSNFAPGPAAQVYQLTAANAITRLADTALSGGSLVLTVPPQSVTLVVIPRSVVPPPDPEPTPLAAPTSLSGIVSGSTVTLRWTDNATNETGVAIERKSTAKGAAWARVATTAANATTYAESVPKGAYNYRVQAVNATTGQASAYSNQIQARVR